jgi:choline-sulfatase
VQWARGLVGAVVMGLGCGAPEVDRAGAPERIVLVVADTLRRDHVGAYGGRVPTPNLDALAARGQVFERAFSAYHQTSMSMGSLFTGLTPSIEAALPGRPLPWAGSTFCGMARFRSKGDDACVPAALPTLAEDLSAAGYWTIGVTANPLLFRPYGFDQGFDDWREVGLVPDDALRRQSRRENAASRTGSQVNQSVAAALAARSSDRFFLYAHYLDVHDWILMEHAYRRGVVAFDRHLRVLLDLLEKEGLLDGTVVIVTADHGEALQRDEHPVRSALHVGNPSYDSVLRVPFIVAPPAFEDPGRALRGNEVRELIGDLAGVPSAPAPAPDSLELFVSEQRYRTYRDDGFKSAWPRNGEPALLFDLASDPGESRDVAASHPDVIARHAERIEAITASLREGTLTEHPLDSQALERLRVLGYVE